MNLSISWVEIEYTPAPYAHGQATVLGVGGYRIGIMAQSDGTSAVDATAHDAGIIHYNWFARPHVAERWIGKDNEAETWIAATSRAENWTPTTSQRD